MRRLALLSSLVFLLACAKNEAQPLNATLEVPVKALNYLALGDSYTIGTAIGPLLAYPQLFVDSIASQEAIADINIRVIAQNGWTTADLQNGIALNPPDSNYHLVSILIGVNNQYQKLSISEYRSEFSALLQQAIAFADGQKERVVVLSIPDWGQSPAGDGNRSQIASEIDAFNAAQKEICTAQSISFIDITTASRNALNDPSLIASDGLHFSAKMHQQWLALLYAVFHAKLEF